MKIKNYVRPASLEEAYELNQKRTSRLVGGMMWMRLGSGTIQTAVDLSGLGLDTIEETESEFRIGCMATLRQLELHQGLNAYTEGSVREAVRSIVGVQFRNTATAGGSIWGRFGFSDVLTVFLALDTWIELYRGGLIPLKDFAEMKKDKDILVRIIVRKRSQRTVYQSYRNTKTDFPVLTCSVGVWETGGVAAVGARPGRAKIWELPMEVCQKINENNISRSEVEEEASKLAKQIPAAGNLRASEEYRSHLAGVLIKRALLDLVPEEKNRKLTVCETEGAQEAGGKLS